MQSFYGFISSPLDAAILIYSSLIGEQVPAIKRRLITKERQTIQSGSCFVFHEHQSGMRRWTDGMRWSKSRVEGQFLVYRRIDNDSIEMARGSSVESVQSIDSELEMSRSLSLDMKRSDSKRGWTDSSLCKKTFAISIKGNVSHVICYYTKDDVQDGKLLVPSQMEMFEHLELPREYIDPSNFRLHPKGSNLAVSSITTEKSPFRDRAPSPLQKVAFKQMEPIVNVTPRPSPQPEEGFVIVIFGNDQEKTLRISLSNGWNDFKRIIAHAFMICDSEMDLSVDNRRIDQFNYTSLRNGDVLAVTGVKRQMELDDEDEAALLLTKLSGHVLIGH